MRKLTNELNDFVLDILPESGSAILSSIGIPVTPLSISLMKSIITFVAKIGFADIYNDFKNRQLSSIQQKKLDIVVKTAIETFYNLAQSNQWEEHHPEADQYYQYAVEYAEDVIFRAINESREQKQMVLGSFLGSTMYALNITKPNWDNLFYCSTLITRLSIRQINLIKLINTNFESCITSNGDILCITDRVAISEMKELANSNVWVESFSYQPNPTYIAIPLPFIKATEFTHQICQMEDAVL